LLAEQASSSCPARTVHCKARTEPFLISLSGRSQCREQTKLRDLESRLPQLLIINPRYHPRESPQVLACTGQLEERIRGLPSRNICFHTVCIYIHYTLCQFQSRTDRAYSESFTSAKLNRLSTFS